MSEQASQQREPKGDRRGTTHSLVSPEFLRIIGVWSIIPTYLIAGGLLGWLFDHFVGTFPFGIAVGLLAALAFAVRDSLRLRKEFLHPKEPGDGDAD